MKDMSRSRKTILNSFRDVLIQKHPKLFSVFMIFALIFLVVTSAFLLSDIMSFKSNAAEKGHFSSLYPTIPKENQTRIKSWQDIGTKLMDQCKSILGLKGPDKVAAKNATNEDNVRALLAKNRLAKAKETRTTGGNSLLQNPKSSSNSSRTQTTVRPVQATSPALIGSTESEGGSSTPFYSLKDSSPKEGKGNNRVDAVTSSFSPNQPRSNEIVRKETVPNESITNEPILDESVINDSILNEPIMNEPIQDEPVMNESFLNEPVLNDPAMNKSRINQSQRYANLSSNTSESLPITDLGSNGTRNSSYSFVPRNTTHSFDNLSSGSPSLSRHQVNLAALNSTEIHEGLAPDKNDSTVYVPQELNHKNNEMNYQNETINQNTNDNSTQEEKTKNESLFFMHDQKNVTSDGQINISLEGHTFAPRSEIISANNSSSQIQEPKQNPINNRTEAERNSRISSLSLSPKLNSKTEGTQNRATLTSSSGSARFHESKKSQTNNVNRFKSLKVPTPSWMAKSESMNKMKKIK